MLAFFAAVVFQMFIMHELLQKKKEKKKLHIFAWRFFLLLKMGRFFLKFKSVYVAHDADLTTRHSGCAAELLLPLFYGKGTFKIDIYFIVPNAKCFVFLLCEPFNIEAIYHIIYDFV